MRASRPIALLAGLAAVALATVVVASPVAAATLPDGQRITVGANSGGFAGDDSTQLFEVNPGNAVGSPVGTPSIDPDWIAAIDVNDDGHGYVTGSVSVDEETNAATLWAVDANTGTFGSPVTITIPMLGSDVYCPGIDYSGGRVLITCNQETEESFITILGAVDPATGDVDVILAIEGEGEGGEETFTEFTALAMSPAGVLWAFGFDDVTNFAAIVDLDNETLGTRIPIVENDGEAIDGADFARDGQLFASVRPDDGGPALATVDLGTGVVTLVGEYSFITNPFQSAFNITVWGKPALAATGSTGNELVLPVGLGSALLLLAGAAFVATSRIQRRATA